MFCAVPPPRATPLSRYLLGAALGCVFVMGVPATASALNYERNDTKAREVGLSLMRTPVEGLPITLAIRGSARRHIRHLYYGTSLWLGYAFDNRPMGMFSGSIGLESADTAFEGLRTYGELGIGLFWAASENPLQDVMAFHAEGGMRWNLRDWDRPHVQLAIGVRAFANFGSFGLAAMTGLNFVFD